MQNGIVIIGYWHSRNRFACEVLKHLDKLGRKYKNLRIIAMNPFEPEQTVKEFAGQHCFEFVCDRLGTYINHGILHYPTLLLMTEAGSTIIRQEGIQNVKIPELEIAIRQHFPHKGKKAPPR